MNIRLKISQILIFDDYPQLFTASDQVGAKYICLLTGFSQDLPNYICLPISSEKLTQLVSGKLDLREAFINSELGFWYEITNFEEETALAKLLDYIQLPNEILPNSGFYLPLMDETDKLIIQEVSERDNTMFV